MELQILHDCSTDLTRWYCRSYIMVLQILQDGIADLARWYCRSYNVVLQILQRGIADLARQTATLDGFHLYDHWNAITLSLLLVSCEEIIILRGWGVVSHDSKGGTHCNVLVTPPLTI